MRYSFLVLLVLSFQALGARKLTSTDCAFLVENPWVEVVDPYGDGGSSRVYRDQIEDEISRKLVTFRVNRRGIPGYFDMMNFLSKFPGASQSVRERAYLDMTGAYQLAAESDTDSFSAAMGIHIVKDMLDRVVDAQPSIPEIIRPAVSDSVLSAMRPQLRKHSGNPWGWATTVQFPICQIMGVKPDGSPGDAGNGDLIGTIHNLVRSEDFGRFDSVPAFETSFEKAVTRQDPKRIEVGWLLIAAANARPVEMRDKILVISTRYLEGGLQLTQWEANLRDFNERFLAMRANPR